MKNEQIRISAKTLGYLLTMPNSCPRCAWLKLKCDLPYQIFPGVFLSIDSYTKKITWSHYERDNRPPNWLKTFSDYVSTVNKGGKRPWLALV